MNPIIDERFDEPGTRYAFADPKVIRVQGSSFIFGTGRRICFRTTRFTPQDMQRFNLEVDYGSESGRASEFWGFTPYCDVHGHWHAYLTLHYGRFRTSVHHFIPAGEQTWTAQQPITRWRHDRHLLGDTSEGGIDAYDSHLYTDEDGSLYLVTNRFIAPGRIAILAYRMLDPVTLDPDTHAKVLLSPEGLRSEDRNPGGIQLVESVMIQKVHGWYVLLYSVGDFDLGNYKIGAAYSRSLIPPHNTEYDKVLVEDPQNLWGNPQPGREVAYVLQTQHEGWGNYAGKWMNGPGIGSLLQLEDRWYLIHHARRPGVERLQGQGRYVWRTPVQVAIGSELPREQWIVPELPAM